MTAKVKYVWLNDLFSDKKEPSYAGKKEICHMVQLWQGVQRFRYRFQFLTCILSIWSAHAQVS